MKSLEENRLPEGWVWTTLGEIARWGSGGTPLKGKSGYYGGGIPWLKIGDLNEGSVFTSSDTITQSGLENSSAKWVEKGSLLVAMYGSIGKLGIAGIKLTTNQAIAFTKLDDSSLSTKFVFWYIRSIRSDLFNQSKGATQKNISQTVLKQIHFPLPPLHEQHRIVTKIEELFTQLDAGVGALTNTKVQLKHYHQSVLKSACEGRLVPTEAEMARAEGRDYDPADVLLARIGKERREKWGAEKRRRGKKNAKYKEPAAPGVSGLPGLPEGWCWATVEQLNPASRPCAYGVLQPGNDVKDGVFLVRVGDISNGRISIQDMKRIKPEIAEQYPRTRLQGGEVLITLVGAIGRTAVVPASLSGANTARAVGVISLNENVKAEWVEIWFRNPQKIREITSKAHEVARKTLNLEDVRVATVALPPITEQHRIVAEIERRLSVADETKKTIDQSLKQAERLRQSILKRAFEGKLVPQDSNDEPASVLLERIKAEKAKREAEKKTKNKRKRKGNPKQKRLI